MNELKYTLTYSDGKNTSTTELFYGSSADMSNPVENITCNIVDKTNNKVNITKIFYII